MSIIHTFISFQISIHLFHFHYPYEYFDCSWCAFYILFSTIIYKILHLATLRLRFNDCNESLVTVCSDGKLKAKDISLQILKGKLKHYVQIIYIFKRAFSIERKLLQTKRKKMGWTGRERIFLRNKRGVSGRFWG